MSGCKSLTNEGSYVRDYGVFLILNRLFYISCMIFMLGTQAFVVQKRGAFT